MSAELAGITHYGAPARSRISRSNVNPLLHGGFQDGLRVAGR